MLKKILLACGVLSSVLYVGTDLLAAVRYGAYHSFFSQAISELGAVGAPTKPLVDPLFTAYGILLAAFGVGLLASAGGARKLRVIGALLISIWAAGLLTPAMHLRGTSNLAGDAPHIVGTAVIVLCILAAVGLGASLFGRGFRLYSWATLAILLVSFVLTGISAGKLAAGQPTPWLGAVERANLGAYLLWVAVLAVILLRRESAQHRATVDRVGDVRPAAL
jgi:hypothetical protein